MIRRFAASLALALSASGAAAQDATSQQVPTHAHTMDDEGWMLMQDGVVFVEFNRQGGPRGGSELVAPNWWMGMASRDTSRGRFTFNAMFSLDPATVGADGYREIFQAGEALNGQPLVDRQHPHDFFMQLAAIWRIPIGDATGLTIAGGPAGEPALGPVAFMHRASAADNPSAPLSHHTFDSTHVAFGVVTAAIDRGPFVLEASVFNGREPDDRRWNVEFGRLDSVSGRVWFKPRPGWEFQISSGRLTDPEQLEPGHDVVRSTASASWTGEQDESIASITAGFGRNDTDHGTRSAFFLEGARHARGTTLYGRFEALQVETALLQTRAAVEGAAADGRDAVVALTMGGARDILSWRGFEGGIGADAVLYRVPDTLQPAYSPHPVSFHVYFRLRPPAGAMGRMWNMRMSQPMGRDAPTMMNHPMP